MSLAALAAVRRQNVRPAVVSLIVGPKPKWWDDDERTVHIDEGSTPEFLDWRPVVGVPLAVFQTKPLPELTLRAMEAARKAGARFYGAADRTGVYPMTVDATDEHAMNLQRTWELLCRS